jgi:hypothetical protein
MLTGSFIRVEERFVVTAEIVNIASGESDGAASVRGRYTEDLRTPWNELCLKLLPNFGPEASVAPRASRGVPRGSPLVGGSVARLRRGALVVHEGRRARRGGGGGGAWIAP